MPAENHLRRGSSMLLVGSGQRGSPPRRRRPARFAQRRAGRVHSRWTRSRADGETDVSVGSYIGIRTRHGLVIGVTCEIAIEGTIGASGGAHE